jgi:hypothetical protein
MSLLEQASLVVTPNGYKAGTLFSVVPNAPIGDLTFSRAGALPSFNATRVNSDGLIEQVLSNVPRLDYSDGGCPSLLVEPQSTNLALRSNELSTVPNVLDGVVATTNFYTSPDGSTNAIRLAETVANDRHGFFQYYTVTAQTYTVSVFTKQIGRRYISLMSDLNGTNTFSFFDLQNKVVVSSGVGYTCSIKEYADGWLRLSATVNASVGFRYTIWGGSTNGTTNTYIGNTSTFMTFYGLQLEALPYATSYIPTVASTVTRVAETCSKTGLSSYINSVEGVLFVEIAALADLTESRLSINNGTNIQAIQIRQVGNASNTYQISISNGSVNTTFTVNDITSYNKIAISYKVNDTKIFANGVLIATDTNAITFTANSLNQISFDRGDNSFFFYGKVKNLQVYPTALSDLEIETLTSYTSFEEMALALDYTIEITL